MKPPLYIHVGRATHFLRWEIIEFKKYFTLAERPSAEVALLSFGPDVLEEASKLPALKRFGVLFPGFGKNPVHNLELREAQRRIITNCFDQIFINPGPLEIAYDGLINVSLYPFSVDVGMIKCRSYRKSINSVLHVSNDGPQKDWQRSQTAMQATGLKYEVFPPRDKAYLDKQVIRNNFKNKLRTSLKMQTKYYLPHGYVDHSIVIKKYQQYDGFVHIAGEIKNRSVLDGKYTASFIEAGLTGAILFWHDTFNLGNDLKTVFSLSKDPIEAAQEILEIRSSIDVQEHSRRTREELLATFNPQHSVKVRAEKILPLL